MERHKVFALVIFFLVALLSISRDGSEEATPKIIVLAVLLVPILFYRIIAFFSGFGFPEYFARDFKSENRPGPYAFFFWILFLIACGFVVFQWSVY